MGVKYRKRLIYNSYKKFGVIFIHYLSLIRFKSACSWAPIDMSPIDADKLNLSFSSPIAGPSLKATGKAAKRPAEEWREILAEVTRVSQTENQEM